MKKMVPTSDALTVGAARKWLYSVSNINIIGMKKHIPLCLILLIMF